MKFKPNDYFLKQYPNLLKTKEVCEILWISSKTVYKMIHDGGIKAFAWRERHLSPRSIYSSISMAKTHRN